MKRFQEFYETATLLPFLLLGTIQENGPSWKSSFNVVVGLMLIVLPAFGGYVIGQQTKTDDRQDAAIVATIQRIDTSAGALGDKLIVVGTKLAEATTQLNELKAQFDAEKRRRETRDELELADKRAAAQAAKK